MKRAIVILAALALLVPSAYAAKVKIGFVNSITGPEAPIGEDLTNGVTLAVEDLKIQGIDVDLVKEDDTGKPEKSMAAFEKFATRDKVAGVVGPYSSKCANALAKLAEKYKMPLLIPVAAKDDITRQGLKWTFRLSATTTDYATILLDMVSTSHAESGQRAIGAPLARRSLSVRRYGVITTFMTPSRRSPKSL